VLKGISLTVVVKIKKSAKHKWGTSFS